MLYEKEALEIDSFSPPVFKTLMLTFGISELHFPKNSGHSVLQKLLDRIPDFWSSATFYLFRQTANHFFKLTDFDRTE